MTLFSPLLQFLHPPAIPATSLRSSFPPVTPICPLRFRPPLFRLCAPAIKQHSQRSKSTQHALCKIFCSIFDALHSVRELPVRFRHFPFPLFLPAFRNISNYLGDEVSGIMLSTHFFLSLLLTSLHRDHFFLLRQLPSITYACISHYLP